MRAERKVLLVDVGVGLVTIVSGIVFTSTAALDLWWAGAVVAVATAVFTWSEEHGVIGGWSTIALVAAFGIALLGTGLAFGADAVANAALPVALVGLGFGMICYRLYFGLVRSVPDRRLRRVGDRGI